MEGINDFIIEESQTIKDALLIINRNGCGLTFVVRGKKLTGVVSDGDLRRYLLKEANLEKEIKEVMNKGFIFFHVQTDANTIRESFNEEIKYIPLVDDEFNLVDIASANKTHRIPILEPDLNGNEIQYVKECIYTNWISSQGKFVKKFEKLFSEIHAQRYAVSVSNGTVALHLALKTMDIGLGDEVIVPNITFAACANSVILAGAEPVFCEIDKESWCISPKEIENLITSKTKVIMIVHLYGQVADIPKIRKIADKYNLIVLEDCAEAIGSKYKNKPVGTFGDVATFSFFGNKTISTGEGGMVVFKDENLAKKARILRDHGMDPLKKYWHQVSGFNYRITNLQAAIGVAQLERFKEIVDKKIQISNWYQSELSSCKGIELKPANSKFIIHSNWLFTVILNDELDKKYVIKRLLELGIETRRVFYSLNEMPPFKNYRTSNNLTFSKKLSKQGISLPSSVSLQREEVSYVVNSLNKIIENNLKGVN